MVLLRYPTRSSYIFRTYRWIRIILTRLLIKGHALKFLFKANLMLHNCVDENALLPLLSTAILEFSLNHGKQFSLDLDASLNQGNSIERRQLTLVILVHLVRSWLLIFALIRASIHCCKRWVYAHWIKVNGRVNGSSRASRQVWFFHSCHLHHYCSIFVIRWINLCFIEQLLPSSIVIILNLDHWCLIFTAFWWTLWSERIIIHTDCTCEIWIVNYVLNNTHCSVWLSVPAAILFFIIASSRHIATILLYFLLKVYFALILNFLQTNSCELVPFHFI